ncbi:cell division and transport-associated protein TolA [Rhodovulum bhavnagarense]|uniref:Cell division and transport-associated protein TolA n=1 Tax=Rhodovulum bhavnagarense TaxID=992286 RepID=A0A4R2RF88_9RHOB|nr:hypothetical protein [Rhodovulum bhavnagarense]TCP62250.1 cell division and transport-associated protein TolA [Rhodovulum bhavnagarense]
MRTGIYISGAAHLVLIAWVMLAGLFSAPRPAPVEVSEVSLISAAEFAALTREATAPAPVDEVAPPQSPALPASPRPAPPPENRPDRPAPPAPQEPTMPDTAPDTSGVQPLSEADIAESVPQPDLPEASDAPEAPEADRAPPRQAPRVAPTPAPPAPEDVAIADLPPQPMLRPDPLATGEVVETPPAAPQEATTEIVTEAEQQPEAGQGIARSPRPLARPSRSVALQAADAAPAEVMPPSDAQADALADAVAQAVADAIAAPVQPPTPAQLAGTGIARGGPTLNAGERDALRLAVSRCWNVGALSSEALMTTIVVGLQMQQDGRPRADTLRLLSWSGGSQAAAQRVYDSARSAIIRCGASGFPLPPEKYDQWRDIEITFDPEKMRTR